MEASAPAQPESDTTSVIADLRTQRSYSPSPPPTPASSVAGGETSLPPLVHLRRLVQLPAIDSLRGKHKHAPVHLLRLFTTVDYQIRSGQIPPPDQIALFIDALGRARVSSHLPTVYAWAQISLQTCAEQGYSVDRLRNSWVTTESAMVCALAHSGELEEAAGHRENMIKHNCAPSADAYGALISNARETTDDATIAEALYEEARRVGTAFNTFLYNTVISKLSRARKGNRAIGLYDEMIQAGVQPNSVTFGALINACCRMGDAESAERFFAAMVATPGFAPRAPPYNTLIQYFVQNEPNRAKALEYFQRMVTANVRPTAHTYKLLLDIYGCMTPVDVASMNDVFAELERDPKVELTGTHWASLITSWGCVQNNIDLAMSVFQKVKDDPASAGRGLPDAIVYQAILSACVVNERIDLCDDILEAMPEALHQTAYVLNVIIKIHSMAGRIDKARLAFESLEDPPTGVASKYNHAFERRTHQPVDLSDAAQVYREPSTYESIMLAERAHGGIDVDTRINSLLDRAAARGFPAAVMKRLRSVAVLETSNEAAQVIHSATIPSMVF